MLAVLLMLGVIVAPHQGPSAAGKPQSSVVLPPAAPTVPADVSYALGQQSSQLTIILGRLQRIEDQMVDLNKDTKALQANAARANTIIEMVGWTAASVVGVLIALWIKDAWTRKRGPGATAQAHP